MNTLLSAQLNNTFQRLFAWLTFHRKDFFFKQEKNLYSQLLMLKPFGEFILCVDLLLRFGIEKDKNIQHLQWAWSQLEDGEYLLKLLAIRPDLIAFIGMYTSFYTWGYRNSRLEQFIQYLHASNSSQSLEIQQWRRVALQYNFARLELCDFPSDLIKGSWVISLPEPWTISDEMAYAVTHEVFYITDFGRQPNNMDIKVTNYLKIWMPVWIQFFVDKENWDLTSEFIMVEECLKTSNDIETALSHLVESVKDDGYVMGPEGAGRGFVQDYHSAQQRMFLTNYHTTLVTLMAIAMILARTNNT
jgi:uncharacterized protein DUF6895